MLNYKERSEYMTKHKKLLPSSDYMFKEIFAGKGHERFLINLLESILHIKINKIEIQKEFEIDKEYEEIKKGTIDIQAVLNNEEIVDIEIQVSNSAYIIERTLRYWAGLYYSQLKKGQSYNKTKKTIVIIISLFDIFKDDGPFWERATIKRDYKNLELTNKLEIHYIQIPKFLKDKNKEKNDLADWLYFLVQDKKEVARAMQNNKNIQEVQVVYKELTKEEKARRMAELEEKFYYEKYCAEEYGRETGREEGRKEGKEQGKREEKIKIIKNMLKNKIGDELIKKMAEITEKELEEIKQTI